MRTADASPGPAGPGRHRSRPRSPPPRVARRGDGGDDAAAVRSHRATPSASRVAQRRGSAEHERLEELKQDVHTELLKQLGPQLYDANLDQAELDQRVRAVLAELMSSQERPISNADRNRLTQEISDDILGLRPDRAVPARRRRLRGHGQRPRLASGWSSDGKLMQGQRAVQRRGPPAPHDRQDRLPHRPSRRRVRARWSTPASPTAAVSTPSSRRWPSTAPR